MARYAYYNLLVLVTVFEVVYCLRSCIQRALLKTSGLMAIAFILIPALLALMRQISGLRSLTYSSLAVMHIFPSSDSLLMPLIPCIPVYCFVVLWTLTYRFQSRLSILGADASLIHTRNRAAVLIGLNICGLLYGVILLCAVFLLLVIWSLLRVHSLFGIYLLWSYPDLIRIYLAAFIISILAYNNSVPLRIIGIGFMAILFVYTFETYISMYLH